MNDIGHGTLGESFDDFLRAQGTEERTTEHAIKRVIAYQLANVMAQEHITKVELARRLQTSCSQIDRLLDPENDGVTVAVLSRAAKAVGRRLKLELA